MKKVVLFRISIVVSSVVLTLGALMATTSMPNEKNNGFDRNWLDDVALSEIKYGIYKEPLSRIVGHTNKSLFIAGESLNGVLIVSKDFNFKDTLFINYLVPPEKMVPFSLYVDSPMLYLHINNMRSIVLGKFPDEELKIQSINASIFSKSVQISPASMIIRVIDSTLANQRLEKINVLTGETLSTSDVTNLHDNAGGITTDGMFIYDRRKARLFFLEYFRNKFYCLDTNLNLQYERSTIDTFSTNQIRLEVENVNDTTKKLVPNKARIQINKDGFVMKDYLYVLSSVRSDNQGVPEFNTHYIFDRYSTVDGKYSGSFKVKRFKRTEFRSAVGFNDTVAILYTGGISLYRIPMNK